MTKKVLLLLAAALAGVIFSMLQPTKLKSLGEDTLGVNHPDINVTDAEIVEETDNSLKVRYYLHNNTGETPISACGEVNYGSDGYAWGCQPIIVPAHTGNIVITYLLASTARSIECSDSIGVFFYVGSGHHFYKHLFSYEKIWHKNPGAESWSTYKERGCEQPRPISELQKL